MIGLLAFTFIGIGLQEEPTGEVWESIYEDNDQGEADEGMFLTIKINNGSNGSSVY